MSITTGLASAVAAAPVAGRLSLPAVAFSPVHPLQPCWLVARHCGGALWSTAPGSKATPTLKDPDRAPDSSTLRRWSSGLDRSQPRLSFVRQTLARIAHWLASGSGRSRNRAFVLGDVRLCKLSGPCAAEKLSPRPPSLPGNAGGVAFRLTLPEANSAVGEDIEKLKQRLPLLDYLRQQNWTGRPRGHAPSSSDSVRCTRKPGLRSMSTPAKMSFYCQAADRAAI